MKIAEQVENILRVSRIARNSDKELLIIYMQKHGMELTPQQIEKFRDMPSMETIRRVRQQLQEQGKYPADQAVDQQRFNKFKQVRNNIKYQSADDLLASQGYAIADDGMWKD